MNRQDALVKCKAIRDYLTAGNPVWSKEEVAEAMTMAIEALKNERPKGYWIPQNHNKTNGMVSTLVYYYPKCSVCGHCANYTNFCPNCGADMRGDGE